MKHGKQHWVGKSYLSAWVDPKTPKHQEPYVWRFAKDGTGAGRKAPKNIFRETDLYTIRRPGGGRDLVLEHGLSQLETRFDSLRRRTLLPGKPMTSRDRIVLAVFAAAANCRTPAHRDHLKEQWGGVLAKMDRMREEVEKMSPRQRSGLSLLGSAGSDPTLEYDDVKELAENPLQVALPSLISSISGVLLEMNLTMMTTRHSTGFLTSDRPCVVHDPQAQSRPFPYNVVGLRYDSAEAFLPVSPTQLVVYHWRDRPAMVAVPDNVLASVNSMIRLFATKWFIASDSELPSAWLEPPLGGTPK